MVWIAVVQRQKRDFRFREGKKGKHKTAKPKKPNWTENNRIDNSIIQTINFLFVHFIQTTKVCYWKLWHIYLFINIVYHIVGWEKKHRLIFKQHVVIRWNNKCQIIIQLHLLLYGIHMIIYRVHFVSLPDVLYLWMDIYTR